jgi:uncharacterized protein YciW
MSETAASPRDAIDAILGEAGPRVRALRRQKPELAEQLQAYYRAVFEPDADSAAALPLADRGVIAVRVAAHTGSEAVAAWYANLAGSAGADAETIARARDVARPWTEETPLAAAIRHADMLTTRPAAAQRDDIAALKAAGFTPAGIMSLAQVVAFVSYQLRLIAGLRALGGAA